MSSIIEYTLKVREFYTEEISLNNHAHNIMHCDNVCDRITAMHSKLFSNENILKLCIVAAYTHDLKEHVDRKNHHVLSAEYVRDNRSDSVLSEFNDEEIDMLYNAILEHRASNDSVKTSILSILLFNADKDEPSVQTAVFRSLEHNGGNKAETFKHIKEKFSRNGYLKYDKYYKEYYGIDVINEFWDDVDVLEYDEVGDVIIFNKKHKES